jgi:ribosomal protein L24E
MNGTDDSTRSAGPRDDTCVVCGKDTTGGRGFMTLHVEGRPVPICCPMCYKVYQEDPARYARSQHVREISRGLGFSDSW